MPAATPYAELPACDADKSSTDTGTIFITARFRSGSTLLGNIFRQLPNVTAYYEPLNERRWFDPAQRGDRVDPTHRHATDYWREYEGLECLVTQYREEWIDHRLYMDENAWDPFLKRYIEILIERAAGRPALQFNRVDFRLPWLRRHFPEARLVHLYRNPRDQWCSTLMQLDCFGPHEHISSFQPHDKFYLLPWARDLKYTFPFLDEKTAEHPYELFYFIWKLSYLFGVTYAHVSLAFEDLAQDPKSVLNRLLGELHMDDVDLNPALAIVERPALGKWREYAPDDWFRGIELRCEQTLRDFLRGPSNLPGV